MAFLLVFLDYERNSHFHKIVYVFFSASIILFVAFRPLGIDNDSENYNTIFTGISKQSVSEILMSQRVYGVLEKGFMLLNLLAYHLFGNFRAVLIGMALLTGIINYTFFYKFSPYPFFSLLFYLSFFFLYRDFTQIRYAIAGSLIFWGVYFWSNKRYILSIVIILISSQFHDSAFIIFPLLILLFFVKSRKLLFILPFFCLIGLFVNFFPLILGYGLGTEHIELYLDETGLGGLSVSIVGYAIMLIYNYVDKKGYIDKTAFADYSFKILSIGVSFNLLFCQTSIFQRFSFLMFQFAVVLLPQIFIAKVPANKKYYLVGFNLLFSMFLLFYGLRMVNQDLIRPYF
jgi:hypothetical protein